MDEEKNSDIFSDKIENESVYDDKFSVTDDANIYEGDEEYAFVDVEDKMEEPQNEASTTAAIPSFPFAANRLLLTLLGALIGAIIGIIPLALFGAITKSNPYVLLILVPIGVFIFTKLLHGYTDRRGLVILIVISLVALYSAEIVFSALKYCTEFNVPFYEVFRVSYYLFFGSYALSLITSGILYIIIFSAVGIILLIELSNKATRTYILSANNESEKEALSDDTAAISDPLTDPMDNE